LLERSKKIFFHQQFVFVSYFTFFVLMQRFGDGSRMGKIHESHFQLPSQNLPQLVGFSILNDILPLLKSAVARQIWLHVVNLPTGFPSVSDRKF
jgi:hypothetical protein